MIDHAGDVYEWDFKDRLVKTTTAETIADYVYDYSGQRVIKKSESGGEQNVVYYISKGFEIRDGKSVKYIFDGSRRLARVEGRLAESGSQGWQILNLRSGWNFFSLDVEPDDPAIASVLAPLAGNYSDVWTFDPVSQQYKGYVPGTGINDLTEIHARQGYIIHVTTPTAITMAGTKVADVSNLEAGWNLVACPADTPIPATEALTSIASQCEAIWGYNAETGTWENFVPGQPDFVNNLQIMSPGQAYWIKMTEVAQLSFQEQPTKIY